MISVSLREGEIMRFRGKSLLFILGGVLIAAVSTVSVRASVEITDVWTSDRDGVPKSLFRPGEEIRFHVSFTFAANKEKKVTATGKLEGWERKRIGKQKKGKMKLKDRERFPTDKRLPPGSQSLHWDAVVDEKAVFGSEAGIELKIKVKNGGSDRSQAVFEIADSVANPIHGLNFGPYIAKNEDPTKGGSQIIEEELEMRLAFITPYTTWIRTFGCNEDLKDAGRIVYSLGRKAAIGAWLGPDEVENARQIDCLVEIAREGHVDLAIVGSEVLTRGDLSKDKLISTIDEVKRRLAEDPPVDIPVTTADVYNVFLTNQDLISHVDVVLVNVYPYWEGISTDDAVAYLAQRYGQVEDEAGGKEVIVSETGWPSCGQKIGDAVPSPENARRYFLEFVAWALANDVRYFYFEAFNERWKTKHEGPQGACWGIWDRKGNMKPSMQEAFE
jgi:exo-beta-1,3-glucanase (GH17 family)